MNLEIFVPYHHSPLKYFPNSTSYLNYEPDTLIDLKELQLTITFWQLKNMKIGRNLNLRCELQGGYIFNSIIQITFWFFKFFFKIFNLIQNINLLRVLLFENFGKNEIELITSTSS